MGFLLELTGETSPTGIGIRAYVQTDGTPRITLFQCSNRDTFMLLMRRQVEATRNVEDWQTGWAPSTDEAASMVMHGFGMPWFNRCRAKLIEMGWKPANAAMANA